MQALLTSALQQRVDLRGAGIASHGQRGIHGRDVDGRHPHVQALEAAGEPFGLTMQGEPEALYQPLLALAAEVEDGTMTVEGAIAEAGDVIAEYTTTEVPKLRLEIAVSSAIMNQVIDTIQSVASTGKVGDGKLFVHTLDQVVRIRTGEKDELAIG